MNKLTKYACILTTLAGAVACSGGKKAQGDYAIIPLPQEVVTQGSAPFLLKPPTPISYQDGDAEMAQTTRCFLYTSPSPGDRKKCRMPSSA